MADLIYNIAAIIALAGIVLSFVRLILGPTIADRAVALDGMTIIAISLIVFIAYYSNRVIYLDVAIVYGLISFVGIVAIARYLERGI
ncbi:MAG: cation:proton antiporter [Candidatus Cloacimonetes bacterium]|nr:cation:proton antiporter [Candidatus Cloacimonadota bacterium]MBT4332519.1 cation:proton antiporter [Candidatus Cloacimonadota bacterium]MBT4575229.1 cation:proton antiporter [Candidatus Cloacimonadota bacterium]MBT5420832.1 cation:proton antiporter [Candidatus Cloacimonadota bacterium]